MYLARYVFGSSLTFRTQVSLVDGAYGSCYNTIAPYPCRYQQVVEWLGEGDAQNHTYDADGNVQLSNMQLRANDVIQNYRARAEHAVRDIVVPHHIYRTDMRMRISHTDDDSCRCHMCIITRFIVNKTALWRRVRGPVGAYAASRVGPWGHKPPHMHEPRRARLW